MKKRQNVLSLSILIMTIVAYRTFKVIIKKYTFTYFLRFSQMLAICQR